MESLRARVEIALIAYSGVRLETLGKYEGTDCLKLSDIEEVKILAQRIEFEKVPLKVRVRANLSKARNEYITFLGIEGTEYLSEYLNKRIQEGERITLDSPILQLDPKGERMRRKERNDYLRSTLVARGIMKAITDAVFNWLPYVLRAYFSTALGIAENEGLIIHSWRQFIIEHKGDVEARYRTNKRLAPDMIEGR